jgi:hypothetical protein
MGKTYKANSDYYSDEEVAEKWRRMKIKGQREFFPVEIEVASVVEDSDAIMRAALEEEE